MIESTETYMDAGRMMRRACERGEVLGQYDPHRLVTDVVALLEERGLRPEYEGRLGMASAGAGMLLRALNVLPFGQYIPDDRDYEHHH